MFSDVILQCEPSFHFHVFTLSVVFVQGVCKEESQVEVSNSLKYDAPSPSSLYYGFLGLKHVVFLPAGLPPQRLRTFALKLYLI